MCRGAIRNVLNQSGSTTHPRSLRRPLCDRMDSEKIIPIDPDPRNPITRTARRKCAALTAGETLECRDGPLIVDHVEDDGRAVHLSKRQRIVEVRYGRGPLAYPTGC